MSDDSKNGCLVAVAVMGLCLLVGLGSLISWGCNTAKGVVKRVANPDAIVGGYEWYEQQWNDIKAAEGQIKEAKEAAEQFKKDNGDMKDWKFNTRDEYARLQSNMTGLKQYRLGMVEDYNARSRMISRNLWKSGSLPYHIDP